MKIKKGGYIALGILAVAFVVGTQLTAFPKPKNWDRLKFTDKLAFILGYLGFGDSKLYNGFYIPGGDYERWAEENPDLAGGVVVRPIPQ